MECRKKGDEMGIEYEFKTNLSEVEPRSWSHLSPMTFLYKLPKNHNNSNQKVLSHKWLESPTLHGAKGRGGGDDP